MSTIQFNAYKYFDEYFQDPEKPILVPDDTEELYKIFVKQNDTLEFINSIYHNCFNAKTENQFDEHIQKTMISYKNNHQEIISYEKSLYFVFDLGEYYIETKDKNIRNWIYAKEVKKAHKMLTGKIEKLEVILHERKAKF